MALFLVFLSAARAQTFSKNAATALGCDATTQLWWPVVQDQGSGKAAVVISDRAGAFGQNMLPASTIIDLKTSVQLTAAGWVWPKDTGGNSVIPGLSSAVTIPNQAASGTPVLVGPTAPLP